MNASRLVRAFGPFVSVICLTSFQTVQAQFVFSPFAEASVAYTASSGLGMNFSAANPAMASNLLAGKRFAYTLETEEHNLTMFDNDFPDYCLQLAIVPRFTIALAQSERAAHTEAYANSAVPSSHSFRLNFAYSQDWAVALGYRLKPDLSAGLAMRHETYAVSPSDSRLYPLAQQFRVFDFGLMKTGARFDYGLVLRNFLKDRTTPPFPESMEISVSADSVITWHPSLSGISSEPQFSVEGGIQWRISSHWHALADLTTRKEYALGLRWRVFSRFFVTTGTGKRYDRIYEDEAATYNALGSQFHHANFSLAVTWIIPTRAGRTSFKQLPHGSYQLQQLTNHRLLIGGALSF